MLSRCAHPWSAVGLLGWAGPHTAPNYMGHLSSPVSAPPLSPSHHKRPTNVVTCDTPSSPLPPSVTQCTPGPMGGHASSKIHAVPDETED